MAGIYDETFPKTQLTFIAVLCESDLKAPYESHFGGFIYHRGLQSSTLAQ